MSIGYHGFAKHFSEDDTFVYYAYSGANFNDETRDKNADYYYDGRFRINKEILKRIGDRPKKGYPYIDWTHIAIEEDFLIIDRECQNAFYKAGSTVYPLDYIIYRLLTNIFKSMYETKDEVMEFPRAAAFVQ